MKTLLASLLITLSFTCQAVEVSEVEAAQRTLNIYITALEYNIKQFDQGNISIEEMQRSHNDLMYSAQKAKNKLKLLTNLYKIERGMM